MRDTIGPLLPLRIEVGGWLGESLRAGSSPEIIGREVTKGIQLLADHLGVPAKVDVDIFLDGLPGQSLDDLVRVWIDGHRIWHSAELFSQAVAYVDGRLPVPAFDRDSDGWSEPAATENKGTRALRLLEVLVPEIVKLRPSALLGEAQFGAYVSRLAESSRGLSESFADPTWLLEPLQSLLDLRISLARVDLVTEVLQGADHTNPLRVRELLCSRLATDKVEIRVPAAYQVKLGRGDVGDENDRLGFLLQGMFDELGVVFPPFKYTPPGEADSNCFSFRLNDLWTIPRTCLGNDEILVNDTVDGFALQGLNPRATINPANGVPAAVVALTERESLETEGLVTWDEAGFLVLCLASELRRHAGCFVHLDKVEAQLEVMMGNFPDLVVAARAALPTDRLCASIRQLVTDRVSVRDLELVLERVAELDFIAPSLEGHAVFDDPVHAVRERASFPKHSLGGVVAALRTFLRRPIAHRLARETETVVVYLLDQEIEDLLRRPMTEETRGSIIRAVREELQMLPPTVAAPAILTWSEVADALVDLLRDPCPHVPVVRYAELPASMNIQPVARIEVQGVLAP